jgi:hypothetical protein
VIFIEYSFGGRILEKALAQAIVGQTSAYPRIKVTLPADLTAFDHIRHRRRLLPAGLGSP